MDLSNNYKQFKKVNYLDDYHLWVKEISNYLVVIGEVINDKNLIMYVIRGGSLWFDYLNNLLLRHEYMLEHQASQLEFQA